MRRGWWSGSGAIVSRSKVGLHRTRTLVHNWDLNAPLRLLALALFCAGIAALLAIPVVSAQTTTDYDTDNDGLIEVDSLAKLNAIRWDLNGDGVVDNPTALTDPDDTNSDTHADAYAAAFTNRRHHGLFL